MAAHGPGWASQLTGVAQRIAQRQDKDGGALSSFATCLEPLIASPWQAVAGRFSGLNSDGSPIEFTFATRDRALRFTTEVAGPEIPETARLERACAVLQHLHHPPPLPALLRSWQTLQKGFSLRWGAWLGVRHNGATMRAKLYVEVPHALRKAPPEALHPPLPGSDPVMIGYAPEDGIEELYFRRPLDSATRDAFLVRLSTSGMDRNLPRAVEELCEMPLRTALDWITLGYSVASGATLPEPQFSIFLNARVLGPPVRIRRRILQWEDRHGAVNPLYRELVGDAAEHLLPSNGTISLISHSDGNVEMRVGLSGMALAKLNQERDVPVPRSSR